MYEFPNQVELELSGKQANHTLLDVPYIVQVAVWALPFVYVYSLGFFMFDTDMAANSYRLLVLALIFFPPWVASPMIASTYGMSKGKLILGTNGKYTYAKLLPVGMWENMQRLNGMTVMIATSVKIIGSGKDGNGEYALIGSPPAIPLFFIKSFKVYVPKAEVEKALAGLDRN